MRPCAAGEISRPVCCDVKWRKGVSSLNNHKREICLFDDPDHKNFSTTFRSFISIYLKLCDILYSIHSSRDYQESVIEMD